MSTNSEPSITVVYGAAGLQRWDAETVRRVFGLARSYGVCDLDTAHIYVSLLADSPEYLDFLITDLMSCV